MSNNLPETLKEHILPFNWDVKKLWTLICDTQIMKVKMFEYLFNLPLWSSKPKSGMLFDVRPIDVIQNPTFNNYQYQRIMHTILSYPIDLLELNNKLWILDGVHRLAKLRINDIEDVVVRIHQGDIIERIKI